MKLSREPGPANPEGATNAPEVATDGAPELPPGLPGLRALMDRLLADDGCPWDREQTLDTLRPYLLEETHEVLEAMDDPAAHRGELGDLLFQIVFQSALRQRQGDFDLDDVIEGITRKLVRRHPHVFGPHVGPGRGEAPSAADVERQWAEIKAAERGDDRSEADPFARIPRGLPALARAAKLQRAAADLGFDWPDVEGALAKLAEERDELENARHQGDRTGVREELGDMLFVLVRIAQKLEVDADDALRRANAESERRFGEVLRRCRAAGIEPAAAGLTVLEAFWSAAKSTEPGRDGG